MARPLPIAVDSETIRPNEISKHISHTDLDGMNVLFINLPLRETATPNTTPEGPLLLATNLRQNYGVNATVIDLNAYRIKDELAAQRNLPNGRHLTDGEAEGLISRHVHHYGEPDVVALSGMITTLKWQQKITNIVRAMLPNVFIVSGNGLATELKFGLFNYIPDLDAVSHSEGDEVIKKICYDARLIKTHGIESAINSGKLKPYYVGFVNKRHRFLYAGDRPGNLDSYPFADLDLIKADVDGNPVLDWYLKTPVWGIAANNSSATPFAMDRSTTSVSSRGCPFACAYCLVPETRILYSDLSWRPIRDVKVGDELIGFDEYPTEARKHRKLKTSKVEYVEKLVKSAVHIKTTHRSIYTTENHGWLYSTKNRSRRWGATKIMKPGHRLSRFVEPWEKIPITEDYRKGYLVGMTLGDGTYRFQPGWKSAHSGYPASYWRIALADYEPLERIVKFLSYFNLEANIRKFDGGKSFNPNGTNKVMKKVEIRSIQKLEQLHKIVSTYLETLEFKRGFLAGFFDAEGSHSQNLRMSQKDAEPLNRVIKYAKELGFDFSFEKFESKPDMHSTRLVGKLKNRLEFLALIDCAIIRKTSDWIGSSVETSHEIIEFIEEIGDREVINIQTSTATFFAEGIATHNCYRGQQGERNWGVRSAEHVVQEIIEHTKKYNIDFKGFPDDNFAVAIPRIEQLVDLMAPYDVRWGTHTRMDEGADPRRIKPMAESGCVYIGFGPESADKDVLIAINKGGHTLTNGFENVSVDGKMYSFPKSMTMAIRNCIEYNIHANCTWIMGLPSENLDRLKNSIAFIKWQEDLYAQHGIPSQAVNKKLFTLTWYPGTGIIKYDHVREKLSKIFGLKFVSSDSNLAPYDPVCDEAFYNYLVELDDATKVLHGTDGETLNFGDMPQDVFLKAREFVDTDNSFKILEM